jgi:hypothetical protein
MSQKYSLISLLVAVLITPIGTASVLASGDGSSAQTQSQSEQQDNVSSGPSISIKSTPLSIDRLRKIILLNRRLGADGKVREDIAALFNLQPETEINVRQLGLDVSSEIHITFVQFQQTSSGYIFAKNSAKGLFVYRVDQNLNLIDALRTTTDLEAKSPIPPRRINKATAENNLVALLDAWAQVADNPPTVPSGN